MDSLQKTANVLSNFSPSVQGPSKSFQILVRAIGEAKTKHEEDRIIRREAIILKEKMSSRETTQVCMCVVSPFSKTCDNNHIQCLYHEIVILLYLFLFNMCMLHSIFQRQMREYLIRMLYCEMLGVACPWGHIHAVTFTQKTNLIDKRVGYLVCSLILHPDHELNMLLVNSIQRVNKLTVVIFSLACTNSCWYIHHVHVYTSVACVFPKLFVGYTYHDKSHILMYWFCIRV